LNENNLLREQIIEYETNQDRDKEQVNISQDSIASIDNNYKKNLISRLKRVGIEKEELKIRYEDLKSKERQFHLAQCVAHDSSRRIKFFHHEITKLRDELVNEKEIKDTYHHENNELKTSLGKIQEENLFLSNENSKLAMEVINLKSKFKTIDTDYRKLARLNRFVEKHATSSAFNSSNTGVKIKSLSFQDSPIQLLLHNLEEKYLYGNAPVVVSHTDNTLNLLQNKLMTEYVGALPLIRRLLNDVDSERDYYRVEKNEIFDIFYKELFPHTTRKRITTAPSSSKTPSKK
jgi:chromosome segregation ATPase